MNFIVTKNCRIRYYSSRSPSKNMNPYPHTVFSPSIAFVLAALAASAACPVAKAEKASVAPRIAKIQQDVIIGDSKRKPSVVKSTTLILTGPEARIQNPPEPVAVDTTPVEKKQAAPSDVDVMASEDGNFVAKSQFEMGELLRSQHNPEAIGWYEKAGANGHAFALYMLGYIYQSGEPGTEKDLPLAIEYYRKAAAKRHLGALDALARIYETGDGVEKNPAKAAEYCRIGVEEGVGCPGTKAVLAQKLSRMYAEGQGVPKSLRKAVFYADKGSDGADLEGKLFGDIYRLQAEAESDPEKANALYAKATKIYTDAQDEKPAARYQLGRLYATGRGVPADADKSAQLIKEAADLGYLPAKFEVEHPTAKALGISSDQASVDMVRAAAEAAQPQAQYELGTMLLSGIGVEKNPGEAMKWYRLAAKQNNADAQYALGKMLAEGIGGKRDKDGACEYFKKAAEQKHPEAAFEVAKIYESGDKAVAFYTEAAEGGVAGAQYALGKMFAAGKSVPVDLVKSSKYYRAAADQGDLKAQLTLLKIFFRIHNRTDVEDVQALMAFPRPAPGDIFKYAQNAAENSEPLGQYYLGLCYSNGIGVEKNPSEAIAWLGKASGIKAAEAAR